MNDTDLQILTMYHKDGMKEKEIADSLNLSLFVVYDVLTAFDWTEEDKT
jgi:transposase